MIITFDISGSLAYRSMSLLRFLVLCTLAACCVARSVPGPPLPPLPSFHLLPRSCNDSDVLAVAGFALQNINRDQRDGYILSLTRVHDVWEHFQEDIGSLFYLTLDVLEMDCHMLSRKEPKDCKGRHLHQSVYGQCKAIFHINKPERVLYLPAYNCTLRPVSRRRIHSMCPDCPSPADLSDPRVLEAATESLAKINSENPSKQYSLVKVTRASSQWVVGPSYFVEYLVKESPCTESQASCQPQISYSEPVGICQGSMIQGPLEKFISGSCEFFKSQAQDPGDENPAVNQEPKKLPTVVDEAAQKNTPPINCPCTTAPRGSVQHLPDLDDEKPKDPEDKSPEEDFPVQLDLTTNPQGDMLDVSFLYLGPEEKKLVVLPFPGKQHLAECPGPAEGTNPLILPS